MSNFNDAEKLFLLMNFKISFANYLTETIEVIAIRYLKNSIHCIIRDSRGKYSCGNLYNENSIEKFNNIIMPKITDNDYWKIESFSIKPVSNTSEGVSFEISNKFITYINKNEKFYLDLEYDKGCGNYFEIASIKENKDYDYNYRVLFDSLDSIKDIPDENLRINPLLAEYLRNGENENIIREIFRKHGREDWLDVELLKYEVEGI